MQNFSRGAEKECPHCGFFFGLTDKVFGSHEIFFERVLDHAGALRHRDRVKLAKLLEKLERRIPPVMLAVYFPGISEPHQVVLHNLWVLNHIHTDEAGFPNRKYPVNLQWLLVLVVDVHTDKAFFMWGYQLDPYIQGDYLNPAIRKAQIPLRENLLLQGTKTVMRHATRLVARAARLKLRSKHTQGLLPDEAPVKAVKEETEVKEDSQK